MKKDVFLVPRVDVLVRDPDSFDILPSNGAFKSLTTYWRRRIKCGDVREVQKQEPAKKVLENIGNSKKKKEDMKNGNKF
jgi:hypothetical protein